VDGRLEVLDQRKLPDAEIWIHSKEVQTMWNLIKDLSVRGAPLIGVAAALSLAVEAQAGATKERVIEAAEYLKTSRPTAVNLMYCCDKIIADLKNFSDGNVAQRVCGLAEDMLQNKST